MFNEIKKSVNSTLYERVSSPLFGTLIISWIIWNWKIIYLTFFVSEKLLTENKIEYIINKYYDFNHLVTYPIISTIILLTIIPFISNGAYYLNLVFKKWRMDKKNEVEKKQLLSIEKSIELRDQIRNQENRFSSLLENKNEEIAILKQELIVFEERINILNNKKEQPTPKPKPSNKPSNKTQIEKQKKEFEELMNSGKIDDFIKYREEMLRVGLVDKKRVPNLSNAIAFELMELAPKNTSYAIITKKGKEFFKWFIINN